jgi:4-hydroxy-4-methyl-2-oxoglutarate aldolase
MTDLAMTAPLSPAQIEELTEFDTPTMANALELIRPWDRRSGIMSPRIRAMFPEMKTLVGYASTFLFTTRSLAHGKLYADWQDYWRYVVTVPEPRVSVGQDIDPAPAGGSLWGEVQANIHMALGCKGVILEGAVRDLAPVRALGYPVFAREVAVGHCHAHFIDFGHPVEVGDVVVNPGDLVCADGHGVIIIPYDAAPRLAEMCRKIIDVEKPLIAVCKDRRNFSIERLVEAYDQFMKEYPVEGPPTL